MQRIAPFVLTLFLVPSCSGGESDKQGKPDPGARERHKTKKPLKKGEAGNITRAAKPPGSPKRFDLDDAYATKHGYTLPAKISFKVRDQNLRETNPPAEQRVFLRLDRLTDDGRASEDLSVTSLTVPEGQLKERVEFTKKLVKEQGLAMAMPADGKVLTVQEGRVAGVLAVLGTGEFTAPNSGQVFASMVAVILPSTEGFAIMSHHVVANSPVKSAEDVPKKGLLGQTLKSLEVDFGAADATSSAPGDASSP